MQVVPDGWYIMLQLVDQNSDDWYECGRVNVRNCDHTGKVIEAWYLHSEADADGGYPGEVKPRLKYRSLGSATEGTSQVKAMLNSFQLVAQEDPFVVPSIDHYVIVSICDQPIEGEKRA